MSPSTKWLARPDRARFVYVPFNEPDFICYNIGDKKQQFFNDWKTVYQRIRSISQDSRPKQCYLQPGLLR
jgi:hypothetical protein